MAFRVGQKVAYLGGIIATQYGEALPEQGQTYTIRSLRDFGFGTGMHLREIRNPAFLYLPENRTYEAYFHVRFFRPIVETNTDIAVFKAMLNPSLEDVANLILQEVTLCP